VDYAKIVSRAEVDANAQSAPLGMAGPNQKAQTMTFTHEQILDAVRKAGRDGKTFSCAAVREHLDLSTRDRRVLSRFHRQFRAFQEVAGDEIVKVGNNSYRLKSASVESVAPVEAVESAVADVIAEEVVAATATTENLVATIAAEGAVAELVAEEPLVAEPIVAEPIAAESAAVEPIAAELVVAEPIAEELVAVETVAVEPVAAEPVAAVAIAMAASAEAAVEVVKVADRQLELVIAEAAVSEAVVDTEPAVVADVNVTSVADAPSEGHSSALSATSYDAEPASAAQAEPASSVEESSSFFDEEPAQFEPTSLEAELELHELVASVPVETQPDERRSMLSLAEAAQLFDTPAPRQPSGSRVRSWVSSPLEHAQSLLERRGPGSWLERGQRLGRRVAGLFNRA